MFNGVVIISFALFTVLGYNSAIIVSSCLDLDLQSFLHYLANKYIKQPTEKMKRIEAV